MLKTFNFLLLNKNSILFTSCVKLSKQYLGYYANCSLFNLKGSKSEVTKLEFRLSDLHFSEAILISFVMLNNGKRHFVKRNAWNSRWVRRQTQWRPWQKFSLVGHCLVFVFGWAHCGSTVGGFILALTVWEFRVIFLFHHSNLIVSQWWYIG